MEKELKIKEDILNIAKELDDLKGRDTIALDLLEECSWTSYFIITTSNSNAHLKGLMNEIKKKVHLLGYDIKQNQKNPGNKDWILLDCGDFIIHIFSEESRNYYDLEERWDKANIIYSSSKLS